MLISACSLVDLFADWDHMVMDVGLVKGDREKDRKRSYVTSILAYFLDPAMDITP